MINFLIDFIGHCGTLTALKFLPNARYDFVICIALSLMSHRFSPRHVHFCLKRKGYSSNVLNRESSYCMRMADMENDLVLNPEFRSGMN